MAITFDNIQTSVNIPTKAGTRKWYTEPFDGPFGYSNWPARTNLLTYSEQFDNAAWNKTLTAITPNATTAPDGSLTADKLTGSTTSGLHILRHPYVFSAGVTYTASIRAKVGEYRYGHLAFGGASLGMPSYAYRRAIFDLQDGVILSAPTDGTAQISELVDGWVRISITITPGAAGAGNVDVYLADPVDATSLEFAATIGDGFFVWGAQLEAAPFPSPYIPTTDVTVTRPATNLSMPTAGVLPVNDFGIWGEVIPGASGQGNVDFLATDPGGDTWLRVYTPFESEVRWLKRVGGTSWTCTAEYTYTKDTPFQYQAFQSRVYGMGIRVKEQGGAWSAWATKDDADGRLDAPIASTYQVGARNNINHFAGTYPGLAIIQHSDPKAELERLVTLYGGE